MPATPSLYAAQEATQTVYGREFALLLQNPNAEFEPNHLLACGQLARALGQSQEALRYLGQALDGFQSRGDQAGAARATIEFARLQALLGRYQQAVVLLSAARKLMRGLSETAHLRGLLAFNRGCCMRELGYASRAIRCFEYAMGLAEKLQNDELYVAAYTEHWDNHPTVAPEDMQARRAEALERLKQRGGLGRESQVLALYRWGRTEPDCLEQRIRAYRLAASLGSVELIARASNTLSNAYKYHGLNDLSLVFGEQAVSLARDHGYLRLEALFSSELSLVYRRLGRYQRAKELLLQAIHLREQLIWRPFQRTILAAAYGNLGSIYKQADELDLALNCFTHAYMLHQKKGALKGQRTQAGNIGTVYHKRGQFEHALEWYQLARSIDESLGSPTAARRQAGNLASLYLQLAKVSRNPARESHLAKALDHINDALADQSPARRVRRAVFNLGRKGSILLAMGDASGALPLLIHSYRMCRRHGRVNEATMRLTAISKAYRMLDKADMALKAAEMALRTASDQSFEWSRYRAEAHKALARALSLHQHHDEALEQYRLAALTSSQSFDLIQSEETGINLASRQNSIYEEAIMFCHKNNKPTHAFYFIELLRQPVFRQRLSLTSLRAPGEVPQVLVAEEAALLRRLLELLFIIGEESEEHDRMNSGGRKAGKRDAGPAASETLPRLHKEMVQIRSQLSQVWDELRTMPAGGEYVGLRTGEPVSFFDVRAMLRDGSLLRA